MRTLNEAESTEREKNFAINQLIAGRSNAVGVVTLATGVTTTTVQWRNGNRSSRLFLQPTTANAAVAMATTFVGAFDGTGFTITHANSVTADRTFNFLVLGG